MNFLRKYADAFATIRLRDYLTILPLLFLIPSLFLYFIDMSGPQHYYDSKKRFIETEYSILLIILLIPATFSTLILRITFYPHAKKWIESMALFKKIFGSSSFMEQYNYMRGKQSFVDMNTPDDLAVYEVIQRGSNGRFYKSHKIDDAPGGRRETASKRKSNNLVLFVFKDIIFRVIIYLITITLSPILFILSVHFPQKGPVSA